MDHEQWHQVHMLMNARGTSQYSRYSTVVTLILLASCTLYVVNLAAGYTTVYRHPA